MSRRFLLTAACLLAFVGRAHSADESNAAPATRSAFGDPLMIAVLCLIGVLTLVIAGFALYFFVILPYLRRRPLRQALQILEADERARFPEAEKLLGEALVAGLRRADIATSRFALAYVRAQLGRYDDASAVLADLDEAQRDRETHYLDLWLLTKQKSHEKIENLYQKYGDRLGDLGDTKLMVGMAYLELARSHWAAKRVGTAVDYFKKVRSLDVLKEEIPEHIDDHEVVLGITALFEKNFDQAQKHFEGAVKAAQEADKSPLPAEMGLLLCVWRKSEQPAIDDDLRDLVKRYTAEEKSWKNPRVLTQCTHCPGKFLVRLDFEGERVSCKECRRGFFVAFDADDVEKAKRRHRPKKNKGAIEAPKNEPTPEDQPGVLLAESELLLRNVILWWSISLLFTWRTLPPMKGLPPEQLQALRVRLNAVTKVDPEMSDPLLIAHLIGYFFAADDAAREQAIKGLDKAHELGMNVPEVLHLVEREKKLAQLYKDSLGRFYALMKDYLSNGAVPEKLRKKLKERLNRFSKFPKELADVDSAKGEEETAPSLNDLQSRGQLLHKRVNVIVKNRTGSEAEAEVAEIKGNMAKLEERTKALAETAKQVETVEHDLIATTGEFLLQEEEAPATNHKPEPANSPAPPVDKAGQGSAGGKKPAKENKK